MFGQLQRVDGGPEGVPPGLCVSQLDRLGQDRDRVEELVALGTELLGRLDGVGGVSGQEVGEVEVIADRETRRTVELSLGVTVEGTVADPEGKPAPARALRARCSLEPASIAITPSLVSMNAKSAKSYPCAT